MQSFLVLVNEIFGFIVSFLYPIIFFDISLVLLYVGVIIEYPIYGRLYVQLLNFSKS